MNQPFGDRLAEAVRRTRTPVLVGLDPRFESLPQSLRAGVGGFEQQARAYAQFCREVIDVVAPLVPAVKPQLAFFEELGPHGMLALAAVIRHAQERGLLVILDGKRGDIGSTAEAYARGLLGRESPWGGDALTVNPYLGGDSLAPFVEVAAQRSAGLFVLVKTSNAGSADFQDLDTGGVPLYARVAAQVEELAKATPGESGYGSVGAVVGATFPEQLGELRKRMPSSWLLIPGFGSQGGTAQDVAGGFDAVGLGAIVNNSRGILFAYRREPFAARFGEARWQDAVEAATREMIEQLRADTPAGKL